MNDKDFEGLTRSQAMIKAQQFKRKQGQVSANTSFSFNLNLCQVSKQLKEMTFKLDETKIILFLTDKKRRINKKLC